MTLAAKTRLAIGWLIVTGLCGWFEIQRLLAAIDSPAGGLAWFTTWNAETTLPLLVLLTLPLLYLFSKGDRHPGESRVPSSASMRHRFLASCLVFGVSLTASLAVGFQDIRFRQSMTVETVSFCKLPPAYHDEYSYLLQAQTFADGRLSWPPMTVRPDLFHQFHVLNEHRTASRYFPWTGLWIAPFLQTGMPVAGHWLAGALAAVFFYLTAAEILRPRTALCAGLLIGCSPGLAVFSNLLLAHHPTLLALSVFLWTMVRLLRQPTVPLTLISGTALSLAMLGRPMTAAAFALPWGLLMLKRLISSPDPAWSGRRLRLVAAMGIPLLAGFAVLGVLNQDITGSAVRSAYQEYTDVYTPRHAYGFNNGVRGDARQTPKVLKKYDRWAHNLTWPLAIRNVGYRCLASAQWVLGLAPVVLGLILALLRMFLSQDDSSFNRTVLQLMAASVVTLHLAHIPYWFTGIMHWHYVFETAPLILILVAAGLASVAPELARLTSQRLSRAWIVVFILVALLPAWCSFDAGWGTSKIALATSELSYSRTRLELFNRLVSGNSVTRPALILVDVSGSDPQLSYIINDPEFRDEVLVARLPETLEEIQQLQQNFPDRSLYRFAPDTFRLQPALPGQQ